jgi:transcription antitermination factor NusG
MHLSATDDSSERRWYVLKTKRHGERRATLHLHSKGISTYLPRTREWPRPAVGSDITPLFPGYLFAYLDLDRDYRSACWSPGVHEFVRLSADAPAELPAQVIEFLKSREGPDGLIHCGDGEKDQRRVRLARGPLKDLCGVVTRRLSGRKRVVLLVEFLQHQTRVEVPESWLKTAD